MNQLDAYEHGKSPTLIAKELKVDVSTISLWIRKLGMHRIGKLIRARQPAEPKCPRCKVLLRFTLYRASDGMCQICLEELAMLPAAAKRNAYADAHAVAWSELVER